MSLKPQYFYKYHWIQGQDANVQENSPWAFKEFSLNTRWILSSVRLKNSWNSKMSCIRTRRRMASFEKVQVSNNIRSHYRQFHRICSCIDNVFLCHILSSSYSLIPLSVIQKVFSSLRQWLSLFPKIVSLIIHQTFEFWSQTLLLLS